MRPRVPRTVNETGVEVNVGPAQTSSLAAGHLGGGDEHQHVAAAQPVGSVQQRGHVHSGGVSGLRARHTQPLHDSRRIFCHQSVADHPVNASRNTVYTERTDEPAARGPRT